MDTLSARIADKTCQVVSYVNWPSNLIVSSSSLAIMLLKVQIKKLRSLGHAMNYDSIHVITIGVQDYELIWTSMCEA